MNEFPFPLWLPFLGLWLVIAAGCWFALDEDSDEQDSSLWDEDEE